MVQHTQAISRLFVDELFECVWLFCGIGTKRVKILITAESGSHSLKVNNSG